MSKKKWPIGDDQGTNSTGNSALQATTGVKLSSTLVARSVQSWYSKGGLDTLGMGGGGEQVLINMSRQVPYVYARNPEETLK